jgi:hydroxyethylthiazole kinase-like uncharacterized protein yjeF
MSLREVTPELLAAWPLPAIAEATDKETRGRVLVLGGGAQVAGAVLLSGVAALRTGAGKLQIGAPASVAPHVAIALPEARVFPLPETADGELAPAGADAIADALRRAEAAVIGPGLLDETCAGQLALNLVGEAQAALVADAAAMPALAERPEVARRHAGRLVLTPHAGEMARMMDCGRDEVEADPLGCARRLAASLQAVVALKGAVTFIVSPDGHAWRHGGGSPGLATSGSGDVLAGVIAGLLARGAAPVQAAVWGVAVHGLSGRRLAERIAPVGFLARELLDDIAGVVATLEAGRARQAAQAV